MAKHTVRDGECINSIAAEAGLFWQTIWNDPANAQLKSLRESPDVLVAGDMLFVPDKKTNQESAATDQRHRFRKKNVPAKLQLRIMKEPATEGEQAAGKAGDPEAVHSSNEDPAADPKPVEDEPEANAPYYLDVDGVIVCEGETDADGFIEAAIPPTATEGRLVLYPGTPRERVIKIQLGHLNPISLISGVKQRLFNLGFDCGDIDEAETGSLAAALRAFQTKSGVESTAKADDATRKALTDAHGS